MGTSQARPSESPACTMIVAAPDRHSVPTTQAGCACYCMLMLSRRLQVLLDDERFDRLAAEAKRRGTPIAVVVRDAIDLAFPSGASRRAAAARDVLAAEPMPVPDPRDLRAELDEARAGGL